MGIRFRCPNGHALNVKAFLAGRRGKCPTCDARFMVPSESDPEQIVAELPRGAAPGGDQTVTFPKAAVAEAFAREGAPAAAPAEPPREPPAVADQIDAPAIVEEAEPPADALWYLRLPSGEEFGPAPTETMNTWLAEGRVRNDATILRSDWNDWKSAAEVFPDQAVAAGGAPPVAAGGEGAAATDEITLHQSARRRELARAKAKRRAATLGLIAVIAILLPTLFFVLLR